MAPDKGDKGSHRIPIRFSDANDNVGPADTSPADVEPLDPDIEELSSEPLDDFGSDSLPGPVVDTDDAVGGPDRAELIATRAELKRVEAENAELKDRLARRQA